MNQKVDAAFEKAMAEVRAREEELKSIDAEIDVLNSKIADCKAKQENAIATEDFTAYSEASKGEAEANFRISVNKRKKEQLSKTPSTKDYSKTWETFLAVYEKEFKPLLADYEEVRKELYERFKLLVDMQAKAATLRTSIAIECGMMDTFMADGDTTSFSQVGLFTTLPSKAARTVPQRYAPDAAFFIASGDSPAEQDNYLYKVVSLKK